MIRLLSRDAATGDFILTEFDDDKIPAYAILSHTWDRDNSNEVLYHELQNGQGKSKPGYRKIEFCATQAKTDGLLYSWIDNVCINKKNDPELTEAINSMFRWYQRASRCYVYLTDVDATVDSRHGTINYNEEQLRASRWFTRGWTLQELIAPAQVDFFAVEGKKLGDRRLLDDLLRDITGIPKQALHGQPLTDLSVSERKSWAAKRQTKKPEDKVYSLLGIFGVSMAIRYGEGEELAWERLENKIMKGKRTMTMSEMQGFETGSKRLRTETSIAETEQPTNSPKISIENLLELLSFDEIEDRFLNIRTNHTKTCKWLLEHPAYRDWLNANNYYEHHGFFWIKGKPGCGKSTLMKFALIQVRKSLEQATLLSFFFNARGTELEKGTTGLYRSLVVQLLNAWPKGRLFGSDAYFDRWQLVQDLKTDRTKLKLLLRQLVRMHQGSFVLMIDALDECGEDEIRDMISFFEELGDDAIQDEREFRVLFSSRHYPHITAERSLDIVLEDLPGHSEDIQKYVASKFKALRGKRGQRIREEILEKSSGIFMWVILVVEILNKLADRGQFHALRKKLGEIPADLNELFRDILSRDQEDMDQMQLCLQWILFSCRPLKREELYFAILSGLDLDEPLQFHEVEDGHGLAPEAMMQFILNASKGLAEATKSKAPTIQFIHESVRDFLLKEHGLGRIWPDMTDNIIGASHQRLKDCCHRYVSLEEVDTRGSRIRDIRQGNRKDQSRHFRSKTLKELPFLEYANRYMFAHADLSQREGIDQTSFLRELNLRPWLSAHAIVEMFEIRQHPLDVDILYLLADSNCPHLITGVIPEIQRSNSETRYKNPVFAAMAHKHHEAFDALLKYDADLKGGRCAFPYPSSNICGFLCDQPALLVDRFLSIYDLSVCHSHALLPEGLSSARRLLCELAKREGAQSDQLVDLLLANVDLADQSTVYFQLQDTTFAATRNGHNRILAGLIGQGAPAASTLKRLSRDGDEESLRRLLDAGADVNEADGIALLTASYCSTLDCVKLLLERGARTDLGREYPLQAASLYCGPIMVQMLLNNGADPNVNAKHGGTALQRASASGLERNVKLLLSKGADVHAAGGKHGTALYKAAEGGHESVVRLLLSNGANVNALEYLEIGPPGTGHFESVLHVASAKGHGKTVQTLLEYHADVYSKNNKYGESPCEAATKVLRILKEIVSRNHSEGKPVEMLKKDVERFREVVEILQDAEAKQNEQQA